MRRLRSVLPISPVATIALIANLAAPVPAVGGELPGGSSVREHRLDNGLTVVVVERPGLELAAVNLTVAAGALDDPPGRSGMAHVLEHASLSGTLAAGSAVPDREEEALARVDAAYRRLVEAEDAEAQDAEAGADRTAELRAAFEAARDRAHALAEPGEPYGRQLEAIGALGLNATTTAEATQYFCRLPNDRVGSWIASEADRLRNPLFRRFYAERDVVLREIGPASADAEPLQHLRARVYPGTAAPGPVRGRPDEIRTIDRPTALDHFRSLYTPDRIAIVVVGSLDADAVFRQVEEHFGSWRPPANATASPHPEETRTPAAPKQFFLPWGPGGQALLLQLGIPVGPATTREAAALAVWARLLESRQLSPLVEELVRTRRVAAAVGSSARHPRLRSPALFAMQIYGAPGVDADTLRSAMRTQMLGLVATPDRDLDGARLALRTERARRLTDPATLASELGRFQTLAGGWRELPRRLERLDRLTPAELRRVMQGLLGRPVTAAGHAPSHGPTVELANGLAVTTVEPAGGAPTDPVEAILMIGAGEGHERPEEAGAARLAAEALISGPHPADGERLRRRLERYGISHDVAVGRQRTVIHFVLPSGSVRELLDLLALRLSGEPFPEAAWARARAGVRARVESTATDPWTQGNLLLQQLLVHTADGERPASAGAALPTTEAAEAFRSRTFRPDRMVLTLWLPPGAPPRLAESIGLLERAAPAEGSAPASATLPPLAPARLPAGATRCTVLSGANPPLLLLGQAVELREPQDFYALQVLGHILGNGHFSRLHRRLRLDEELTHTVSTETTPVGPDLFLLRIATQTTDPERAREIALEELRALASDGVSTAEAEVALELVRSRSLLDREAPRVILRRRALELSSTEGSGPAAVRDPAILESLGPDDLSAAAARLLSPDALGTVVVSSRIDPLCTGGG